MMAKAGDPEPANLIEGTGRFADGLCEDLRVCFGVNLRAARLKAGLTQIDVEARTGIKQHHVSQIENGLVNPTPPRPARKLCRQERQLDATTLTYPIWAEP